MLRNGTATALLLSLEPSLEQELKTVLAHPSIDLEVISSEDRDIQTPDVLFCSPSMLPEAVTPEVRVIVVSRHPDHREWLDALEGGASDYCASPFDPRQMQWILNATSPQPALAL